MPHSELPPRNSFTVPYDDEEEEEGEFDGEIEVVQDSVPTPTVEVIVPSRSYAVPESIHSSAGSFTSEDAFSEPPTPDTSALQSAMSFQSPQPKPQIARMTSSTYVAEDYSPIAAISIPRSESYFLTSEIGRAVHRDSTRPASFDERGSGPQVSGQKTATHSFTYDVNTVDDDLTESEVGSVDEFSDDDLFDGDYENDFLDHRAESLSESHFDESDEDLDCGNRGKKLLAEYESEIQTKDGTAACELDNFGSLSQPLSKSEYPMLDKEFAELRNIGGFAPTHTAEMMPQSRQAVSSLIHTAAPRASADSADIRAPSPSDAALVKAPAASTAIVRPEDLRSTVVQMTSDFYLPTYSPSSAWPENTSSSTPYPSVSYRTTHLGYGEGPFNHEIVDGASTAVGSNSLKAARDLTEYDNQNYAPCDRNLFSKGKHIERAIPELSRTSTRLSIDDILDKDPPNVDSQAVSNEQLSHVNESLPILKQRIEEYVNNPEPVALVQNIKQDAEGISMKRKADEISTDHQTADSLARFSACSQAVTDAHGVTKLQRGVCQSSQTVPAVIEKAVHVQGAKDLDQPPHKRAKTGIAGYAAAVLAGAVVGGIGTVAALVALPANYFMQAS